MKYPYFASKSCSVNFYKQNLEGLESPWLHCEACDRIVCISEKSHGYEDDVYERIQEHAHKEPARYTFLTTDKTRIGYAVLPKGKIDIRVVLECPCNYARYVEDGMVGETPHKTLGIPKPGLPS